jgi:hypothetical protein
MMKTGQRVDKAPGMEVTLPFDAIIACVSIAHGRYTLRLRIPDVGEFAVWLKRNRHTSSETHSVTRHSPRFWNHYEPAARATSLLPRMPFTATPASTAPQ